MNQLIGLALLLGACTEDAGDDTGTEDTDTDEPVTDARSTEMLENTGIACIGDDEDDNHDSALVTVMLDECLSGCATDLLASCEAVTDADTVTVTASGSYSVPTEDVDCDDGCVELYATCEADGVATGSFTLTYAGASVAFDGPVTEEHCTEP